MEIHPFAFSEADYAAYVALHNLVLPDDVMTIVDCQDSDQNRSPEHLWQRYIAEKNGRVLGTANYGHNRWSFHPRHFDVNIRVYPENRCQGIGEALYQHLLLELAPHAPEILMVGVREDMPDSIRFITKRGFVPVSRAAVSQVDVTTFDATPFALKLARINASSIAIKTVANLQQEDTQWEEKIYNLYWAITEDLPTEHPITPLSRAEFRQLILEDDYFLPEMWIVALKNHEYIGLSILFAPANDTEKLHANLTGVLQPYRRQGLATAMKVKALQYAQAIGAKWIVTSNEENNPMLALNKQLGFIELPAWVNYEKVMPTE